MKTATATRRTFTISFPADLARQVEQVAAQESRTTSELFREAFRVYRAQQMRTVLADFHEVGRQSNHNGYKEDDVPAMVAEVRTERWGTQRAKAK